MHVEFQSAPERFFAHRMLDYRLRLDRQPDLAGMTITQHAVMLGGGRLDDTIRGPGLDYSFTVHDLRHHAVETFLDDPRLAPFACLAALPDLDGRAKALRRALDLIATVADDHARTVLAQAAVDLAGLRLDRGTIDTTWEDSSMPIPSLTNQIRLEALQEGREEGREEGFAEATALFLRHRFGADARIAEIARRLAPLGPDECLRRIEHATSLDDLTAGS